MEFFVGVALALGVTVFAARSGFDRDRAFYPTLLVVIASYYDLFAILGGSGRALGLETAELVVFAAVAIVGFRTNLWFIVLGLFAHGALDLGHGRLITNPGLPAWWPMFCMAYDWTAAAALAWRLARPSAGRDYPLAPEAYRQRISPLVATELQAAKLEERSGNWTGSFRRLERAHILSQASTAEHIRVHSHMLGWAIRRQDLREALAQVLRIVGAATKTVFGLIPEGNTGGGDVGAFRSHGIPEDLAAQITASRPPVIGRRIGLLLAVGFLVSCGLGVRSVVAAPVDVRTASVEGHSIAYRMLGSGQPVIVMLAGLGDGMDSFSEVAAELAKSATVIIYDRPGYGLSEPASRPADASAAASDLSVILAQTGVRGPYILVGHSLGGLYAEYYAAHHPDQVRGLVLEESRPANFTQRCESAGLAMCVPTDDMVRMMARGVRDEVASLALTMTQVEAARPVRRKPVLVLSRPLGAKPSPMDGLWVQGQAELAARYAGAIHLTAPAGGHYIHREQRDWFVSAVRQFYAAMGDQR
ncbi:alpha/beta fold hydrolase [Phenylobacterium sp.]|uniref:alpha/beta fold hydrolase n=1 Tax=Phenylobacterium sp. TaxID=1871053 RepID=UPI002DE93ED4|nr:alpha/beta fold hydrolase [Phenylobacterium sp.]